jgi:non-specific serine/threonine protein kinase
VRLACTLRQFWLVRGDLAEGRRFFERAVAATVTANPELRAQALMHGGPFLYRQGELAQARTWWEEALTLLRGQNDVAGAARCAGELGAVAFSEGDLDQAAALYAQSAEGFASLNDRLRLGIVSANLAEITALTGDIANAIPHAEQSVAIARKVEDLDGLALALHTLARLRHMAGDAATATSLFAECLARAREIGYREVMANCVQAAAELGLEAGGEPQHSMWLLGVARQALSEMGVRVQGLEDDAFLRTEAALVERLGVEQVRAITNEAREVPLEQVIDGALGLLGARPSASAVED